MKIKSSLTIMSIFLLTACTESNVKKDHSMIVDNQKNIMMKITTAIEQFDKKIGTLQETIDNLKSIKNQYNEQANNKDVEKLEEIKKLTIDNNKLLNNQGNLSEKIESLSNMMNSYQNNEHNQLSDMNLNIFKLGGILINDAHTRETKERNIQNNKLDEIKNYTNPLNKELQNISSNLKTLTQSLKRYEDIVPQKNTNNSENTTYNYLHYRKFTLDSDCEDDFMTSAREALPQETEEFDNCKGLSREIFLLCIMKHRESSSPNNQSPMFKDAISKYGECLKKVIPPEKLVSPINSNPRRCD